MKIAQAYFQFRSLVAKVVQKTCRDDAAFFEGLPQESSHWLEPKHANKFWVNIEKAYAEVSRQEKTCLYLAVFLYFIFFGPEIFFPRASERRVLPIVGVCISPSHLHTFSSSHLLIFTSAHLHIFSHICSSSHLLIFTSSLTSAHLHICSSSYLLSHLLSHLLSSAHLSSYLLSHLLIFTSAHLHIFSHIFSHICSSSHLLSHLLIFTSAHLHTFSHIFSPSHLLSFLSPFSLSRLLYLSLFRPSSVVPAASHETATLSHEMRVDRQKLT